MRSSFRLSLARSTPKLSEQEREVKIEICPIYTGKVNNFISRQSERELNKHGVQCL